MWRDKSNFIIGAPIEANDDGVSGEQLWAHQLGERLFRICCIPFFVYDLALDDVVETDADFEVIRVVTRSGRYVFRVYFNTPDSTYRDGITARLAQAGSLLVWSSANLLAVDAEDESAAARVADFLWQEEQTGKLVYETGKTA